jgi:alpha-1,3-rhamnosyl/mannosyltransferase
MGWHTEAIMAALENLESHQVIMLGYIPQCDLPKLVAAATVMAYPSFYEGFGMPVVEAMAAGTPVLAANCSALPEVSNGAAVLVDPADSNAITEGLLAILSDETLRTQCRDRGLLSAQRYCWQRYAKQLHQALTVAAGGFSPQDDWVPTP